MDEGEEEITRNSERGMRNEERKTANDKKQ